MEAFKFAVDIDNKRKVVVDLPADTPLGKAEIMIIIQPLADKGDRRGEIDLAAKGITPEQAAEMRNRVLSFEEDWNAPGMEIYDEV
ncbi:hypothetical protein A2V82_06035 [candidate division KSB1 bacterium RBG_16_48_16]|nr:MAG: hypothetical protein A2V82_06035 [candidate division KSB1 bacterium RBG_16_48_16]